MAGKQQRQHRIARLLEEHRVTNQSQLTDLLAEAGVTVNQATVSRDLEELGAIKVRVPGGETAYAIPEMPKEQVDARGPPAAGAQRLGGRGRALRRPGGAADASRLRPRRGFGDRPQRSGPV